MAHSASTKAAGSGTVRTANGTITPDQLGRTLMHEHLIIGFPGWETDGRAAATAPARVDAMARAIDRIHELQDAGIRSMVDPCPIGLGRDARMAAELGAETGFHIVVATGLYLDAMAASHWKYIAGFEGARYLADTFVDEIENGIGDTGVRAGIIKVATGPKRITRYEATVLEAAAIASNTTGVPITTHTDRGLMGDEQQAVLTGHGVPAHRIVVGHCCGTTDHAYHSTIASRGSYLGFDRFGIESEMPDEDRVASLTKVVDAGYADRVVVSQDTSWCWYGKPASWAAEPTWHVLRFVRDIAPRLVERGVTEAQIDGMLVDNPRRFFADVPL